MKVDVLIFLLGVPSFAFAMFLLVKGVKSQQLTPLRRALVLFGAAAFSVPGFMSLYMVFVIIRLTPA
ncbi:hypothetical protein LCM4577_21605 [Mesorhizobium sp. LCM 4577]|nr:hypothetical protein LCM4577_21605 [Mesorhizobium sp. LCM 4577]OHV73888.1 hypothetical protein LCM4576_16680 [Mesorhizobium sp. LCM 4576]